MKSIFIYVLVALFLCFEMAVQVSPGIMTTALMQDLNINAGALGWMSGFYFYTYTLMQIPAGFLFDQFKVRTMLVLPLLICACGAFCFGQARSVELAAFARLLMGFGSAFAFIAVLVVAADLFHQKYFGLLVGLTQMLAAFGAMGGELPLQHYIERVGWRATMSTLALIGTVLALLIFMFVRYEKVIVFKPAVPQNLLSQFRHLVRKPQTWLIALYACLLWVPMTAFASLWGIPFLMSHYGLSIETATSLISVMWLGLALSSPLLGWWSDTIKRRVMPLVVASCAGLISFAVLLYVPNLNTVVIAILLFLAGGACAGQALSFAVVKDITDASAKASAIGFNNMAVVISGAIFQPLTGKLIQAHWQGTLQGGRPYYTPGDYRFALSVVVLGLLIAALVSWRGIKETHCQRVAD